ncbi:hypothetical protein SDC9_55706 [bioreactor metagenome]|uniref:Uncharacterized protein n=1 Tax=bioreactor metagenome TaxID=1076179 RepID=A0A644WZX2_9ZZZZ
MLPDLPHEEENPFRWSGAVAPEDRRTGHHEEPVLVEKKTGESVTPGLAGQGGSLVPDPVHKGRGTVGEDRSRRDHRPVRGEKNHGGEVQGFQGLLLEVHSLVHPAHVVHVGVGVVPEGPVAVDPKKRLRFPGENVLRPGGIFEEGLGFKIPVAVQNKHS